MENKRQDLRLSSEKLGFGLNLQRNLNDWQAGIGNILLTSSNQGLKRLHSLENRLLTTSKESKQLNLTNSKLESTIQTRARLLTTSSSSSLCMNDKSSYLNAKKLKLEQSLPLSITSNRLLTTSNTALSSVQLHSKLIEWSYDRIHLSISDYEPIGKRSKLTVDAESAKSTSLSDNCSPRYDFKWPELIPTKEDSVFREYDDVKKSERVKQLEKNKNTKVSFVNAVSSSLIRVPNLKDRDDAVRKSLVKIAAEVSVFDPEFVLKVALYARQELNIRSTCNLLLAYASYDHNCRPFLRKYFCSCIVLPSDWIEVAEQYQLFDDKSINFGSLPSSLRKVLALKFLQFDVYQLAKYNRNKTKKKKKKKENEKKEEQKKTDSDDSDVDDSDKIVADENDETEEERERRSFNLKQLIRLLHIKNPAEHVMGLIGKRYPEDADRFRLSRLPGTWDAEKAGQRMKLPVPVTWETQVSAKGNRASTWQELLDKRKLPYMAMLRNLRNMILAGISDSHHTQVINYIANKTAVVKSRQLPHRFLAAREVLNEIEENFQKADTIPITIPKFGISPVQRKKLQRNIRLKNVFSRCNSKLFKRYQKAVNRAIEIAAFFNIPPISGTTLLLFDVSNDMDVDCSSAKGLGKPRTVFEIAQLLTKMCLRVCEMCTVQQFYQRGKPNHRELQEGETMLSLGKLDDELFTALVRDKKKIDNLIVFTIDKEISVVSHFVSKYRLQVNNNLLYVTVGLAASKNNGPDRRTDPNDVHLAGFSDSILRFIAERGNGGRIGYIERIDAKYNLKQLPKPLLNEIASRNVLLPDTIESCIIPKWRTVKVFISSTFLDMHGERDLLIRYIFPELRSRARSLFLDVHEVDLRWGITEEEANNDKALEICLNEISKCQLFIGMLGERYGTVVESYDSCSTNPEMDWLKSYPKGASITELEFHYAALASADKMKERAFFFLRDKTFYQTNAVKIFTETKAENREKLKKLKERVRKSGLEVFDGYPCKWGGIIDGKPMAVDLDEFGQRVLNNLWNALQKIYANESENDDKSAVDQSAHHVAFAKKAHETFVGRKRLIETFQKVLLTNESGRILICGKQGIGKTSLMGHLVHLVQLKYPVVICFIGATNMAANSAQIISYLCDQVKKIAFSDVDIPDEYRGSVSELVLLLSNVVNVVEKLYIFIDGLDLLEESQRNKVLEWLNINLASGINVVCSVTENGVLHRALSHSSTTVLTVGPMEYYDRMELVKNMLSKHRKVLDEGSFNNQLRMLVSKYESGLPLFIYFACEELRSFGVFEMVTRHITEMGSTIEGLLKSSLDRLELDFGVDLVEGALGFIVVCREGLEEDDLYQLLGLKKIFASKKEVKLDEVRQFAFASLATTVPRATFSRLMRSFYGLLLPADRQADTPLRVAHSKVVQVIRMRYSQTTFSISKEQKIHRMLAGYFWAVGDAFGDGSWAGCVSRSIVCHLLAGGCYKAAENILCNLNFIRSKAEAGLLHQLLDEYIAVDVLCSLMDLRRAVGTVDTEKLKQYKSFVSRNIEILKETPQLTIQQALNERSSCHNVASQAKSLILDFKRSLPLPVEWTNKPDSDDRCQLTLKFSKPVSTAAMSPDGQHISVGEENIVRLYSIETGKEIRSFTGHTDSVTHLLFLSNTRMVSSSRDATISIWDVHGGHRVFVLAGHTRRVSACCCDLSGKTLASVGSDSSIHLWSTATGKEISVIELDNKWSPYNCVAFHPQRQVVATGSWDGAIKIWDLIQMKRIAILHGHEASVSSLNVSLDGQFIVSCSLDCTLKIWSFEHGFQISTICTLFPLSDVKFSALGSQILAAGHNRTVQIYSSKLGDVLHNFDTGGSAALSALILLPDGVTVIAGFNSGSVQRINTSTGNSEWSTQCGRLSVTCMILLSDSNTSEVVIGLHDGLLQILNENGILMVSLLGHSSSVTAVACTKRFSVSGSENGQLVVHHLTELENCRALAPLCIWSIHNGAITSIVFNWNKSVFATTSEDQTVRVWSSSVLNSNDDFEYEVPDPLLVIRDCHNDVITSCCWVLDSKKNHLLVTASYDLSLSAWNSLSGDKMWTKEGFSAPVMSLTSSRTLIVTGARDGTVDVWNADGIHICCILGSRETAIGVLFQNLVENYDWSDLIDKETETKTQMLQSIADSLQDVFIARGTANGFIEVLRPRMSKERETLFGHSDAVLSLCSSVDGKVVTSSLDKTVRVWKPLSLNGSFDVDNKTLRQHFAHSVEVTSLAHCKTGSFFITGDRNGTIIFWKEIDKKWSPVFQKVAAHDKTVTGIVFVTNEKNQFATCSDDCKIKIWKFVEMRSIRKQERRSLFTDDVVLEDVAYSLELQSSTGIKTPVITFVYSSKKDTLFIGTTKNFIFSIDLKSGKHSHVPFIDKNRTAVSKNITSWILHMKLIEYENKSDFVICDSLGNISVRNAFKDIIDEDSRRVISLHNHKRKRDEDSRRIWPCSLEVKVESETSLTYFIGLTSGEVVICDKKDSELMETHSVKIAGSAVRTLSVMDLISFKDSTSILCSGSDDGVVRIWKLSSLSSIKKLEQIGQFHCKSSVTQIQAFETSTNSISIICGDSLGNVYFLSSMIELSI